MKTPEEIKHTLRYCWCKDEKYQCIKCPYNKENDSCDKALDADALAYIQQLEDHIRDLTKMVPHWISVKERLPEDAERVYVALRGGAGGVYIAQYFKNKCQPQEDFWILENDWEVPASPTHWMPLPQPPEED